MGKRVYVVMGDAACRCKCRCGRPEYFRRYDLNDRQWKLVEPYCVGMEGQPGRTGENTREFLNATLWIVRTGAPWRDLPPEYGYWNTHFRRFRRWCILGVWDKLFLALRQDLDFEWYIMDATYCKVHKHGMGAKGGSEGVGKTKGGPNTKIFVASDSHGTPVVVKVDAGTVADSTHAIDLLGGYEDRIQHLIADRAFDFNTLLDHAKANNIDAVIPPKKNRTEQREYDTYLYTLRHIVENTHATLKEWRGVATRYVKRLSSYLAFVQIRCIFVQLRMLAPKS